MQDTVQTRNTVELELFSSIVGGIYIHVPLATDIHMSPHAPDVVSYKKRKKRPHANAECEMYTRNNNPKKWVSGPDLASLPGHL